MIDLVDQGSSTAEIRNDCDGDVDGSCSLTQVVKLAKEGKSLKAIERRCAADEEEEDEPDNEPTDPPANRTRMSRICQTPQQWCQMGAPGPVGGSCWCNTPLGYSTGVVVESR